MYGRHTFKELNLFNICFKQISYNIYMLKLISDSINVLFVQHLDCTGQYRP